MPWLSVYRGYACVNARGCGCDRVHDHVRDRERGCARVHDRGCGRSLHHGRDRERGRDRGRSRVREHDP